MRKHVETYCTTLLKTSKCARLPFHNFDHTREVVAQVQVISDYIQLSQEEREPIIIAAWFHDVGHSKVYDGHEKVSKEIAATFLEKAAYNKELIIKVLSCIEATRMPQKCTDIYTAILCDADVFHIGTPHFFYKKLLLRREWYLQGIMCVKDAAWHQLNLKFIHDHHFQSKYGKEVLEKGKRENEKKVKYLLSFYK